MATTFLWGSSTNAQQFEGGRNEGGVGTSIADVRVIPGYEDADFSGFKIAADHYHHLEEDLDLYAEMGFETYRFSMAWTRIFPQGDETTPNAEGLAFYDRMVDGLVAGNIVPICTLYAYDLPQHLVEKYGGWATRQSVEDYTRYVATVVEYFKGRIKYYVPFNEYNCIWIDRAYMTDTPVENDTDMFKVIHHMDMCYAHVYEIVHRVDPEAKVGTNIANNIAYPASPRPEDVEETEKHKYFMGWGLHRHPGARLLSQVLPQPLRGRGLRRDHPGRRPGLHEGAHQARLHQPDLLLHHGHRRGRA